MTTTTRTRQTHKQPVCNSALPDNAHSLYTLTHTTDQPKHDYNRPSTASALATSETTSHNSVTTSGSELTPHLYRLMSAMWKITQDKTLAGCHRWRAPEVAQIPVVFKAPGVKGAMGKARFAGLQNSHSVWSSPLSALAILMRRRLEVTTAETAWRAENPNHSVLFLTCTLRHNASTDLGVLWDALGKCWTATTSGSGAWQGNKSYQGDQAKYGVRHWVKSVEVTHGKNGWHPHLHILLFLDRTLTDDERATFQERMQTRWLKKAEKLGLEAPREDRTEAEKAVALSLEDTDAYLAEERGAYVTKGLLTDLGQVEGLAKEITYGSLKRGRRENRTPFQILEALADDLDAGRKLHGGDVQVWRTWEKGSKNRRFMAWSKDTKAYFKLQELTDAQACDQDEADALHDATVVGRLSPESWEIIQSNVDARNTVIKAMESAKTALEAQDAMVDALDSLGVSVERVMIDYQRESMPAVKRLNSALGRPEVRSEAKSVLRAVARALVPVPASKAGNLA